MVDTTSSSVLVYNGEIYNFREIRKKLERKGYVFRSKSDTEVLLYLYHEKGEQLVNYLRGMYAFVIWDAKKKILFCARDPYGIKPLYYSDDGKTLRIASQVKALLASDAISKEQDPAGICGFYLFGHVPEPYTCLREIKSLPAGSILRCELGRKPEIRSFFSVSNTYVDARAEGSDVLGTDGFARAIRESVLHHMMADVPVGIFLSSGIDSGAILGLMRDVSDEPIDAFTLSFDEYRGKEDDEEPLAAMVADYYDAHHRPYVFPRDEISRLIPEFLEGMDQPSIDGLNTWLMSHVAKEHGLKVVLSGLGGDELMGGYPSFRDIPKSVKVFHVFNKLPKLGEWFRQIVQVLHSSGLPVTPKLGGLLLLGGSYAGAYLLRRGLFMPWELQNLVGEEFAHEGLLRLSPIAHIQNGLQPDPETDFGRVAALESTFYLRNQLLRDSDWAGMDHSVEIRTPLVDAVLLGELAPLLIDSDVNKNLKELLAQVPRKPLPDKVRNRKRTGFTLPIPIWLEAMPALDIWRRVPLLAIDGCHWARRWAYTVMAPIFQPS
jgi:asparagine synthase (glutamine-hydrolysing)